MINVYFTVRSSHAHTGAVTSLMFLGTGPQHSNYRSISKVCVCQKVSPLLGVESKDRSHFALIKGFRKKNFALINLEP